MNYFNIDLKLSNQLKSVLIKEALESNNYYYHRSTKSNLYTNLDFLPRPSDEVDQIFCIKPNTMSLLKIDPNKLVDWHTDAKTMGRQTVVIFPLTSNYAPCTTEEGDIPHMDCYAFNTQLKHKVQNNNQTRISLQLFYDMPIEELYRIHVIENKFIRI